MANEVKILISAVDKASATLNKVQGELKQTGQVGKTSFLGMGSSALAAVGGITAVAGAAVAAAKTAKSLADQYQAYAFQVEDFGHIVGTSAEESSKLIQAADDARISISSLQVSLKQAVSKGYEPNIAGLAKLSDQYNAIIDPIERSRFAMEIFGRRSGPEMVKLLELGGDAIVKMGDSIEGTARLMTEEGVQAAKDYYAAIDDLSDSWQDLTLTIGQKTMPVITDAAELTSDLADSIQNNALPAIVALNNAQGDGIVTLTDFVGVLGDYFSGAATASDMTSLLTEKTNEYVRSNDIAVKSTTAESGAIQIVKEKSDAAAPALDKLTEATIYGGEAAWKASDAYKAVASGIAAADAAAARLEQRRIDLQAKLDFSMPDIGGQIENFFDSKKWADAGGKAIEAAFGQVKDLVAKNKITDAQASQMFGAIYTQSQMIQVELGNITAEEAAQNIRDTLGKSIQDARDLVKKLKAEASFKVSSYIDIYYRYANNPQSGQIGSGRAMGGPVRQNEVYVVGERGPEIFVPDTSGRVISNADSNRLASGSGIGGASVMVGSVNIYTQRGQSPTAIAQAVVAQLNTAMKSARRSGLGYTG